jgi:hypothetical protein
MTSFVEQIEQRDGVSTEHLTPRERWLADMDPGIAPFVDVLDAYGVETYESCEGGEGHCYAEPAVRFEGDAGAGLHAVAVALSHGLPVDELRRFWSLRRSGEIDGPTWEIVFRRPAQDGDVDHEWVIAEMEMQAKAFAKRATGEGNKAPAAPVPATTPSGTPCTADDRPSRRSDAPS